MMKRVNGMHAAVVLAAVCLTGCQQAFAECGIASTYSSGSRTANGERYNHMGISAAHRSLPFGSRVVVRNRRTGRSITVRINDRGPFVAGRIIDLSTGAKNALGMDGLAPVCLEAVNHGGSKRGYRESSAGERLAGAPGPGGEDARKRAARAGKRGTRTARPRGVRKHYAGAARSKKRYASARHRKGYSRKLSHRRQFASREG